MSDKGNFRTSDSLLPYAVGGGLVMGLAFGYISYGGGGGSKAMTKSFLLGASIGAAMGALAKIRHDVKKANEQRN
jgi:hypothetical protein